MEVFKWVSIMLEQSVILEQGSRSADFCTVFCRRLVSTKEIKVIKHMQKEGTGSQPSWTEAPAQKTRPEDNPEPCRTLKSLHYVTN